MANLTDAVAAGAVEVHDGVAGNICYDWVIGDKAVVDGVFAGAAHVVKLDLVNNRLIPNAMEPRVALGDFDTSSGDFTLYTTSQNPHVIRLADGRVRAAHPGEQASGGGAGCRRRVRFEDLPLRRRSDRDMGGGQVARPVVKWTCRTQ